MGIVCLQRTVTSTTSAKKIHPSQLVTKLALNFSIFQSNFHDDPSHRGPSS